MTSLSGSWTNMVWLNPPPAWHIDHEDALVAISGDKTDFWQRTFYGFRRDDGHALLAATKGDFSATVTIQADYETLYDQCGLLLRISDEQWVKFGIEYTHEGTQLSCVVTDQKSDWSAATIKFDGALTLRLSLFDGTIMCQWLDRQDWRMARLLPCPDSTAQISVGPYLCSPEREGFEAQFRGFELTEPKQTEL